MSVTTWVFLAAATTAGAAAGLGSDAAAWTPEQRATIEKVLSRASVKSEKTTPREQDAQRAKGVPVELTRAAPEYPRYVLAEDAYGCVEVSFDIMKNGKTDQFEVVKAEPAGVFDRLAMALVMATDYEKPAAGQAPLRHRKTVFVLLPRPLSGEFSRMSQRNEDERNRLRAERRAACEATGS